MKKINCMCKNYRCFNILLVIVLIIASIVPFRIKIAKADIYFDINDAEVERDEVRFVPEERYWTYEDSSDYEGGVCITGYNDFDETDSMNYNYASDDTLPTYEIVVPSTLGGKPVVEIEGHSTSSVFFTYRRISSVVLPDSVKKLDCAFQYEEYLNRVTLPEGLEVLDGTFRGCIRLKYLTLPSSLNSLEDGAFRNCESLQSMTIPSNVDFIEYGVYGCFGGCSSIEYYEVEEGNKNYYVEDGVLYKKADGYEEWDNYLVAYPAAKRNTTFHIAQYTHIELLSEGEAQTNQFVDAKYLRSITVDEKHARCVSVDGVVFNKDRTFLNVFPAGRIGTYEVPEGCKIIGEDAFAQTSLSKLVISDSVEEIGSPNFLICPNLTSVSLGRNVSGYGVTGEHYQNGLTGFKKATALQSYQVSSENPYLIVEEGLLYSKNKEIIYDCPKAKIGEVVIPNDVTTIENGAFCNCYSIDKIVVPKTVTNIKEYAFDGNCGYSIYGYTGSVAEIYAKERYIPFVSIDETSIVTTSPSGNPTPTPMEDVLGNFHIYLGYTNTSGTESFFHQEKPGIIISGDGNYTFSYTIQETDTNINVLLLETDLDYYDVVDRLCITPTMLVCGGKEYDIHDYGVGYELQENGRYAYRIFLRNPYVGNFEGLGGVIIPVTAGNVISIDFTVEGMGKKANAQPTNTPLTTPDIPSGIPTAVPTVQETSVPSGTKKTSTTKHTFIKKPGRVTINKLKKKGQGCAKITWKKVKCNEGYQIQYSRKRNFSTKKKITSFSKSTFILGKSKKTYYVRVRAVNMGWISQTKYGYKYGKWSKAKKIKLQ